MRRLRAASFIGLALAIPSPASAFSTPFTFHCKGNACHAAAFNDEGAGCTAVTDPSRSPMRITQGTIQLDYVL